MAFASKSPWVIHYDGSSCNGCDIEVLATLCPGFDGERFGVVNTGNPKHADIFLVTGSVNEQNIGVVREIYDQMLEPKVVVACGICACTGGVFHDCYNVIGGVDKARERGMKVIIVDPRITPAVEKQCDLHLRIKPGTDCALALGLARELIINDWVDHDYIEKNVYGYEQYKQ